MRDAMPLDARLRQRLDAVLAVVDNHGTAGPRLLDDARRLWRRVRQFIDAPLVTDGVVRDIAGVRATELAVWCNGTAAPPSVAGLTFVNWQEPIGCGGVAVFPDDVIVADDDGAVVIPAAFVDDVVALALEQEALEAWIMQEVENGKALPGLYPPDAQTRARYEQYRAMRESQRGTGKT